MDIATRAVTRLDVNGQFPQWSPDGQFITYTDQFAGRLHIMRANGTEQRTITTPTTYGESAGYDFTSDGKWIVVRGSSNIDLVNVADGSTIPLPYSRTYFQPAFKP
jgi:Tol biopolymer transport system component